MSRQADINPAWDKEIEKAIQDLRENKHKINQTRLNILKRLSK